MTMQTGEFVFLGWSRSAEFVADNLVTCGITESDKIVVVSERTPNPSCNVKHVLGDYSNLEVLSRLGFKDVNTVLIFAESNKVGDEAGADASNVFTAIGLYRGDMLPPDTRMIVEVSSLDYARILRTHVPDVEVLYKERLDANLIANTIINPGKTSELWQDIADFKGDRIATCRLKDLADEETMTVRELRIKLSEGSRRIVFLGYLPKDSNSPVLNPGRDELLSNDILLYVLTAEQ